MSGSSVLTKGELDEALDWLWNHTHWISIRRIGAHWSVAVFVEKPKIHIKPPIFEAASFSDAVESALGHVIDERARLGIRGGD